MTNLVDQCTVSATGNGATTVWPFTFYVAQAADLDVRLLTIATGEVTILSGGQYSAALNGEAGGTVTYPLSGSPLANTHKIIITRVKSFIQELDLSSGVNVLTLENQLDYLSMQIQQLKEKLGRAPVFPIGEVAGELLPSVIRKSRFLGFDSNGNFETLIPYVGGVIPNDAISNDKLANMAQSTFKMRAAGAGTGDPIDGTVAQALAALGIDSNVYTPTLTNVANISAATPLQCQWLRVGNTCTVSGRLNADPTTAGVFTQLGVSLPIASNFSAAENCAGTHSDGGFFFPAEAGSIIADFSNDRAELQWMPNNLITSHGRTFHYTYRII